MQEHMRKFAKKCTFFKIFHPFTASRQSRRCLEGVSKASRRHLESKPGFKKCTIFKIATGM